MTDFIDFEVSVEDNNKNEEKDDEVTHPACDVVAASHLGLI